MSHRGVLLCPAGSRARNLCRAIRSVGVDVSHVTEQSHLLEAIRAGAAFAVVEAQSGELRDKYLQAYCSLEGSGIEDRAILIADIERPDEFVHLLQRDLLRHLIASSSPRVLARLSVTLAKLLHRSSFGLEVYVPWGVQIQGFEIRGSDHKNNIIDQMAEYLQFMGVHRRLATLARTVADEFLMNAIFDAPVGHEGQPLFASTPRNEDIAFPEPHRAEFRFCCTGDSVLLSIIDTFGSLSADTVRQNLRRTLLGGNDQIRTGEKAGAGVGLYLSFSSLAEWIINISPARATEMIGVIRTDGTYRDHIATPKSFHLFEGNPVC